MSWLKSLLGKTPPRTVVVKPSDLELIVEPGETILEQALKKGIAYPHDCTVGTCGACRTKLLSGTVDAITPFGYTLSKEELDAGYILACQSLPKSELVVEVELQAEGQENITTNARIASTTPLTHDIMMVEWESDLPMHYRAGQYVNVRWNSEDIHRSYSFATAPEKSGQTRLVTFVRHVPGGAFTDMLFSGRAKRDLYGEPEISSIKNAWTAGFDFWPVLSETPEPNLLSGLVTEHIGAALERLGPDAQAYLCGPPAMIDAAMEELARQGIPLDAIFYDKFTDASTAQ